MLLDLLTGFSEEGKVVWYFHLLKNFSTVCCDPHTGSDVKEFTCNAGDLGLIHGLGRSLGEGIVFLLASQYSCLEDSIEEEPSRLQSKGSKEVT